LEILLEAERIPKQSILVESLRRSLENLRPASIRTVSISARKIGDTHLAWENEITLNSDTESQSQSETGSADPPAHESPAETAADPFRDRLSRALEHKNIQVRTTLNEGKLRVMLEAAQVPDRQIAMMLVQREVGSWRDGSIHTVEVYGRQSGDEFPAWSESFRPGYAPDPIHPPAASAPEASSLRRASDNLYVAGSASRRRPRTPPKRTDIGKAMIDGLIIYLINPIEGLPAFYESLSPGVAVGVGLGFLVLSIIFVLISFGSSFGRLFPTAAGSLVFRIIGIWIAMFVGVAVASLATRKLLQGEGSVPGDMLIAGAVLIPQSLWVLISGFLGIGNSEIIIFLFMACITYVILTIYAGCNRISEIPDATTPIAVTITVILSAWLFKILFTSFILGPLFSVPQGLPESF
jgi:hypothetical protein